MLKKRPDNTDNMMSNEESILSTVSFLNRNYPQACSFSLGRPNPDVYASLKTDSYRKTYEHFLRQQHNFTDEQINDHLYTYGPSQGIITQHIAKWLAKDENIHASEKAIFITNGCQEAYNLILLHELRDVSDAVLIIEPAYFGFSDVVSVLGKSALTVSVDDIASEEGGFDFSRLHDVIGKHASMGKNIRLIYINPDFNNPMGWRLSTPERNELLAVCRQHDIKIIEDSTYSGFSYDDEKSASIKSLDQHGQVWYVGSMSKIMCPSLRLGYLISSNADNETFNSLLHIKDHTSLSTSAFNQQIVAGFLIEQDYTLQHWLRPLRDKYRARRDAMLAVIDEELAGTGVTWQRPEGGFFLYLHFPVEITTADLIACASEYQVTFLPVSYFSQRANRKISGIRLAFSFYSPEEIRAGTRRFCHFVKQKLAAEALND